MSAERLREAAALMRERAERATGGPWISESSGPTGPVVMDAESTNALDHVAKCGHYRAHSDAAHIASWHPAVALAVADWLEGVALFVEAKDDEEYFDLDGDPIAPEDTHAIGSALNVADAYLGSAS